MSFYFIAIFSFLSDVFQTADIGGLYDCCNDCDICCYGCWCPSCLYGENAVQIDGSDYDEACMIYFLAGRNPLAVIPLTDNRRALREKYALPEEPCDDCSVVSFCSPCAVCQAARELKIRNNMPSKYIFSMRIICISWKYAISTFQCISRHTTISRNYRTDQFHTAEMILQ